MLVKKMISERNIGGERLAVTRRRRSGNVMYGPYDRWGAGEYRVEFRMSAVAGKSAPDEQVCAVVEAVDADGDVILAQRPLRFRELADELRSFALEFELKQPARLEYRVNTRGVVQLAIDPEPRVEFLRDLPPSVPLARLGIGAPDLAGLQDQMRTVMRLLQPVRAIDQTKVRVGRHGDGGYIQLDHVEGIDTALSFGINDEVSWDEMMADRGLTIYQFDHTVDAPHPDDPRMVFAKEMISDTKAPGRRTLAELIERHDKGHPSPNMMLKIDIEGSEWSVFEATSAERLGRFSQIVCELHSFQNGWNEEWREGMRRVLAKLSKSYAVVHVHANVCGGVSCVAGLVVPNVLEVSFANRSLFRFEDTEETFPGPLDVSCSPMEADIYLDRFRF